MKHLIIMAGLAILVYACSDNASSGKGNEAAGSETVSSGYDTSKGAGKFTHVEVNPNLDKEKALAGEKVYDMKCASCHKLTGERLVGPGWAGVTGRHTPEWIMNFTTNVDEMLQKDPKAQAMLEICLVRMPNQNLTDDEARNVYEFMRKNDGIQ
jgi:cytochrome c2